MLWVSLIFVYDAASCGEDDVDEQEKSDGKDLPMIMSPCRTHCGLLVHSHLLQVGEIT